MNIDQGQLLVHLHLNRFEVPQHATDQATKKNHFFKCESIFGIFFYLSMSGINICHFQVQSLKNCISLSDISYHDVKVEPFIIKKLVLVICVGKMKKKISLFIKKISTHFHKISNLGVCGAKSLIQ